MSLKSLAIQTNENLLRFLWRQWSQLGAAGLVEFRDRWIIDPEALLVFTLSVGRHDARLFDEVIDWTVVNGRLVSIQRLKNIADTSDGSAVSRTLSALAAVVDEYDPKARWSRLAGAASEPRSDPEPFFFGPDGRSLPVIGDADDRFLRAGYLRARPQLRGLSQPVPMDFPTNLIFRLRALFGLGPRAETVAYLLTHSSGRSSEIARSSVYSRTQVQEALTWLAMADVIAEKPSVRQRAFRTDADRWLRLLNLPQAALPDWVDWPRVFSALTALAAFLGDDRPSSEYLLQSDILTLWPRISLLVEDSGLQNPFARVPALEKAVDAFAHGVKELTDTLLTGEEAR